MLFLFLALFADPSAAVLLRQGLLDMQAGKLSAAEQSLTKASALDQSNPYIWATLAETQRRRSEIKPALEAAGKAEQLGGKDPAVAHALAMFYSQLNRPEKAAPLEQRFAESAKADAGALARTAELYRSAGRLAEAIAIARQALQQHATADAESTLARSLTAAGQPKEALPHFKAAWQLAGNPLAFEYVQALLQAQSFNDAGEVAASVAQSEPANPQWPLVLGVARYGQRRFEEAITAFLKAITIDPSVPQPYLFLGNLLEQAGPQLDQVIAAEQRWAKREPDNAGAQLTYAKALLQKDRRSAEAKTLLQKAASLAPTSWEAHYQIGVLLEAERDFAGAAVELQRAIELKPQQPLPHYHLARVYDRSGKSELAAHEREIHQRLTSAPSSSSGAPQSQ